SLLHIIPPTSTHFRSILLNTQLPTFSSISEEFKIFSYCHGHLILSANHLFSAVADFSDSDSHTTTFDFLVPMPRVSVCPCMVG
ncbi:hypothetical protein LINPERPRIM_LOCUS6152, partial [Linum perenne]